ncbi:MAG: PepSY-like domain-containing protein [Bacteroidales bacterium]|jgi:uncharacterized lipoprotein NlpE involved in copper resistance|nr:PepSY-like domain-containing protein [Bacteroidales bacterium]
MKKIIITLAAVFVSMSGCDKKKNANTVYQNALAALYPTAKHVEWDFDDGYMTAEFRDDGMDAKVWFDKDGTWLKTETDVLFKYLPHQIQEAFGSSDYAEWKIDDIRYVKINKDPEEELDYYEFDVEKEEKDVNFAVYPDGTIAEKPYFEKF